MKNLRHWTNLFGEMTAEKHFVENGKWEDNKELAFCQAEND
jgi:hypothetical protein